MSEKQPGKDAKYDRLSRVAWIQFFSVTLVIGVLWFSFGQIVANTSTAIESTANKGTTTEGQADQAKTIAPKPGRFDFLTGTYGDTFGVLTALFTGLALAGLWYTIQLQRIELSATRDELRSQAESLKQQAASSRHQAFEGTFFQLLNRFSDVVQNVRLGESRGRRAIQLIYVDFKEYYDAVIQQKWNEGALAPVQLEVAQHRFRQHLVDYGSELNHYFRTLYHVIKLVDESDLPEAEQRRYVSIVRAQLSSYELLMLFYNGLVDEGKLGFSPYIEKYALLKHVPEKLLADPGHRHMPEFYALSAFKSH